MRRHDDVRERMMALVGDFQTSGLSRVEYSRLHEVSVSKFDYWLAKWRKEQEPETGVLEAEFIQLDLGGLSRTPAAGSRAVPDVEVELPHGVRLRFFNVGSGPRP